MSRLRFTAPLAACIIRNHCESAKAGQQVCRVLSLARVNLAQDRMQS